MLAKRAAMLLALQAGCLLAQPTPNATERTQVLEAIRAYAVNFIQGLPDFTCGQSTHWTSATFLNQRGLAFPALGSRVGNVVTQLAYLDHKELTKVVSVDGQPVAAGETTTLPAIRTQGEFGTLLARIFDSKTATEFRWDRMAKLDGRRTYVFSYRVPKESGYVLEDAKRTTTVPFRGLVYADFESKAVLRIELECVDIPRSVSYRSVRLSVNYRPTQVAEKEFVLPSDFEETTVLTQGRDQASEHVTGT